MKFAVEVDTILLVSSLLSSSSCCCCFLAFCAASCWLGSGDRLILCLGFIPTVGSKTGVAVFIGLVGGFNSMEACEDELFEIADIVDEFLGTVSSVEVCCCVVICIFSTCKIFGNSF